MTPTNRPTDQLVGAEDVRLIMTQLGQNRWRRVMRAMEQSEPSLAAFVTTASQTMLMSLHRVGYTDDQLQEAQKYFTFTLVAVYELTRAAYRRLLDPFLPGDANTTRGVEPNTEQSTLKPFDAVVSNADALRWMEQIVNNDPIELAGQLADAEPGVVGVAVHISNKTRDRLTAMGASEEIAEAAASKTLLAGVVTAELLRRGHAQLWKDVWDNKSTGGPNGK